MTHNLQLLFDELDSVLDKERFALLAGDLEALKRQFAVKEALIDQINRFESTEQDQLRALQSKVGRNQDLLTSAMEGVRTVADRMSELRRVRDGLSTYDSLGRKTRYQSSQQSTVEKRA